MMDAFVEVGFRVIWSQTLYDAAREYTAHRENLAAVILDGILDNTIPNPVTSLPLILLMKKHKFEGHMIAVSQSPRMRKEMIKAGCTTECTKSDVLSVVAQLLKK